MFKSPKKFIGKLLSHITYTPPTDSPRKEHQWSIGIYEGKSPLAFSAPDHPPNPVLTREDVVDVRAAFVADPFMLKVGPTWYMFFEVVNLDTRKGEIALAVSDDSMKWRYQKVVLSEPFHLSYPYVFEWQGEYYMVPESYQAGGIRLYKALNFPLGWTFWGTLLNGSVLLDPSIFNHDGRWWLFAETNPEFKCDTLRLYHADKLMGPWFEHPKSPIIHSNPHIARPAGRVIPIEGGVIRFSQDCYPAYGTNVRAFKIDELTATSYHETPLLDRPLLSGNGTGWSSGGMHHIDPHCIAQDRWIASVDGFVWKEVRY